MTRGGAQTFWNEELPKNVLYLYRDFTWEEWTEYTIAERNAERKKKQEEHISRKRYGLRRVPCYIHVFFVNSDFIFRGFFIMILSAHGSWYLNWRTEHKHEGFFERIKQRMPLGLLPGFDDETWFNEFCKMYPMKSKGIQRPRGKYLIHCILDSYNNLIDIEL
jgi:hypothetical protein